MEGSISAIQVALYRRSCDHRTPDDGLERNPHGNLRVLCRRLCLRCLGWLSRTRELGPLRRWPRSRPLTFGGEWHRVSGWPPGGIPALRRHFSLRWGNGRVLSRWRSGASNFDYSGRGIGEDGDAKRPSLVFSMAEMERDGCS